MREIGGDTWGVDDIEEAELTSSARGAFRDVCVRLEENKRWTMDMWGAINYLRDEWVRLEEERERLADST